MANPANPLHFFNLYLEIAMTRNRLPHWQQAGAVYFVTFRLVDSLPQEIVLEWRSERQSWLALHPEPWNSDIEREYHRRFSQLWEDRLDSGHGACVLREASCAMIVAEALMHFDGERYAMISSVVMPNHVHAPFVSNLVEPVERLVHSWKSFTSTRINLHLNRTGPLWQKDYFDRLVRDAEHFGCCVRYIRRNPRRARLSEGEFTLYESDLAKEVT